jgi:hypothetical protein
MMAQDCSGVSVNGAGGAHGGSGVKGSGFGPERDRKGRVRIATLRGDTIPTMSLWSVVVGGAAGGAVTYGTTWYREYRRSAEGYRYPQRQAVGDIVAAKSELVAAGSLSALAVSDESRRGANWGGKPGVIDAGRITEPMNAARSAADNLLRALELARIVVVDPQCRQARDEVTSAVDAVGNLLARGNPRNFVDVELYLVDIDSALTALDDSVKHLVDVSEDRLGLVVTFGTRIRRLRDRIKRTPTV